MVIGLNSLAAQDPKTTSPVDDACWLCRLGISVPECTFEDLSNSIEANPNHAGLYKLRGITRMRSKCDKSALKVAIMDFDESLRLKPLQPRVYILRGIASFWLVQLETGKDQTQAAQDAIDDLESALRFQEKLRCEDNEDLRGVNLHRLWASAYFFCGLAYEARADTRDKAKHADLDLALCSGKKHAKTAAEEKEKFDGVVKDKKAALAKLQRDVGINGKKAALQNAKEDADIIAKKAALQKALDDAALSEKNAELQDALDNAAINAKKAAENKAKDDAIVNATTAAKKARDNDLQKALDNYLNALRLDPDAKDALTETIKALEKVKNEDAEKNKAPKQKKDGSKKIDADPKKQTKELGADFGAGNLAFVMFQDSQAAQEKPAADNAASPFTTSGGLSAAVTLAQKSPETPAVKPPPATDDALVAQVKAVKENLAKLVDSAAKLATTADGAAKKLDECCGAKHDLDPKKSVYATPGPRCVGQAVGAFSALCMIGTLAVVIAHARRPRRVLILYIVIGLWAVMPPMWFWWEYFYLYQNYGEPGTLELFKYGQDVSKAIWAGVFASLVAFAVSDAAKPPAAPAVVATGS